MPEIQEKYPRSRKVWVYPITFTLKARKMEFIVVGTIVVAAILLIRLVIKKVFD